MVPMSQRGGTRGKPLANWPVPIIGRLWRSHLWRSVLGIRWSRNSKKLIEKMAYYAACPYGDRVPSAHRAVIILPPFETDLDSSACFTFARFWRRVKIEEFVKAGHLRMVGHNVAVWTEVGTESIRRKAGNRSPLDYWLMDWEKIQKSEPINSNAVLVTYQAQRLA